MGFFEKFMGVARSRREENFDPFAPKFYGKSDGTVFGAITVVEGKELYLPKRPQDQYDSGEKVVSEWKMIFVSTTKELIIGDAEYFSAIERMKGYILGEDDNQFRVRGLTLGEMEALCY